MTGGADERPFSHELTHEPRWSRSSGPPEVAPGVQPEDLTTGYTPVVRKLDVALLDGFLLREVMEISEDEVGLTKGRDEALDRVTRGECSMAFLLRPPTVEHVKRVAEAGEVMPRKSTYFEPKVASGLVLNKILPAEEVRR